MLIKKYLFFTMPACPDCHMIKEFLEEKKINIEGEEIDTAEDEGMEKAVEFNVMSAPTMIFLDEDGKEVTRASSVDEVKNVVENKSLMDI